MTNQQIWDITESLYPSAVDLRRYMHRYPELSFKEYNTTAYLKQLMEKAGIELLQNPLETGLIARVQGKNPEKRRIMIKADIDALPLQEQNGMEFCSANDGIMHACGHDMHTAVLVSVMKALKQQQELLEGEVIGVFEPGEELLPGGARKLADTGFFEMYPPDLALALHSMPDMESGTIGYCPGNYMASGDEVYITVKGKGGHGGLPHTVADPVFAASQLVVSMQQVVSRNAPPEIPTVIAFGKIQGGTTMNIIPDKVELEGTFRTFNEHWRAQARERIEAIARLTTEAAGCRAEVNIREGYPTLYNHPEWTQRVADNARDILGPARVKEMGKRMTTDDFAVYTQFFPAVYIRLGTHNPDWKEKKSLHSGSFNVDERTMRAGIATMLKNVWNALLQND